MLSRKLSLEQIEAGEINDIDDEKEKEKEKEKDKEKEKEKDDEGENFFSFPQEEDEFYWKSVGHYCMYFLLYIIDWNMLTSIFQESTIATIEYNPNIIHYVTMVILFGAPLINFQNFIGQYTRNGAFAFGHMLPLGSGIATSMLIYMFLKFSIQIYYLGFQIFYLASTVINPKLPWVQCYNYYVESKNKCFSMENLDLCPTMAESEEPCFEPGSKILASVLFIGANGFYGGYRGNKVTVYSSERKKYLLNSTVHNVFTLIMLFIFSFKSVKFIDMALQLLAYFCLIESLTLFLIAFSQSGAVLGLKNIYKTIYLQSFWNLATWGTAFRRVIDCLKIAEGGIILMGSAISPDNLFQHHALVLSFCFCVLLMYLSLNYYVFNGLLEFKLNIPVEELNFKSDELIIFALFPYNLGTAASGSFFCYLFTSIITILNFLSMVIRFIVMEKTITSNFKLSHYYAYIRVFIAICGTLLSSAIYFLSNKLYFYAVYGYLKKVSTLLVCLQLVIVHLYGLQRFCNDIEFFFNRRPATFQKISWITAIVFSSLTSIGNFIHEDVKNMKILFFPLDVLFVGPLFLGFCIIVIVMGKKKNLLGILKQSDKYGPPSIEERIYRILFDPKLSVKYKRRKETCSHECLNKSDAVKTAVEDELLLIENLIKEIEMEETDHQTITKISMLKQNLRQLQRNKLKLDKIKSGK